MAKAPLSTPLKLAVDFGPLLVFFTASKFGGIFVATGAFMVATLVAMAVSLFRTGRIPPMLLFTGIIVMVFGGLTLWLHDAAFVKIKLTVIYAMFGAILIFGLITKRPTLQLVLHDAFPALDAAGWTKLTRNWAAFFLVLAATNEVLRRVLTDSQWVNFKVWGVIAATLVFAMAQAPILARHGVKEG